MKALSLWQPWATLIALGIKTCETRHWRTDYTGPIAIHAAKRPLSRDIRGLMESEAYAQALAGVELPFGAIVAVANLAACLPTEDLRWDPFGDYSQGRFGWCLYDIKALRKPIPMVGRQGLFNLPAELAARMMADLEGASK